MNKLDLIAQVADRVDIPKAHAANLIDAVFGVIGQALKDGDDVRLVGFGTFVATRRAASRGHNPRTGADITIPASSSVKFKPGKALKDLVN